MPSPKVSHKRSKCIGCNSCITIAPQNWEMDEKEGKSRLIGSKKKGDVYVNEIFECDIEANQRAAQACPMKIIKVNKNN